MSVQLSPFCFDTRCYQCNSRPCIGCKIAPYLLPVIHVVNVIRDGRRGWSDSTSCCHTHTNSGNYKRGTESKGCQSQTSDGCHTTHSSGGAASNASDLGLVVEIVDVVSDAVECDGGLPEDLSSLCEDLVEDTQATMNLVCQDAEWPGIYLVDKAMLFLYKCSKEEAT